MLFVTVRPTKGHHGRVYPRLDALLGGEMEELAPEAEPAIHARLYRQELGETQIWEVTASPDWAIPEGGQVVVRLDENSFWAHTPVRPEAMGLYASMLYYAWRTSPRAALYHVKLLDTPLLQRFPMSIYRVAWQWPDWSIKVTGVSSRSDTPILDGHYGDTQSEQFCVGLRLRAMRPGERQYQGGSIVTHTVIGVCDLEENPLGCTLLSKRNILALDVIRLETSPQKLAEAGFHVFGERGAILRREAHAGLWRYLGLVMSYWRRTWLRESLLGTLAHCGQIYEGHELIARDALFVDRTIRSLTPYELYRGVEVVRTAPTFPCNSSEESPFDMDVLTENLE